MYISYSYKSSLNSSVYPSIKNQLKEQSTKKNIALLNFSVWSCNGLSLQKLLTLAFSAWKLKKKHYYFCITFVNISQIPRFIKIECIVCASPLPHQEQVKPPSSNRYTSSEATIGLGLRRVQLQKKKGQREHVTNSSALGPYDAHNSIAVFVLYLKRWTVE